MRERLYTAQEAADALGITARRVRALAEHRGLGTRLGQRMLVLTAPEVEAMRERRPGRPKRLSA